jgi:hypothetical protein
LGWRNESSPTSINGLVMTAANEFQLNYPRIRMILARGKRQSD